MLRVRDGEVEKLGILYERYRGPLFNYFVRLTGAPRSARTWFTMFFWACCNTVIHSKREKYAEPGCIRSQEMRKSIPGANVSMRFPWKARASNPAKPCRVAI